MLVDRALKRRAIDAAAVEPQRLEQQRLEPKCFEPKRLRVCRSCACAVEAAANGPVHLLRTEVAPPSCPCSQNPGLRLLRHICPVMVFPLRFTRARDVVPLKHLLRQIEDADVPVADGLRLMRGTERRLHERMCLSLSLDSYLQRSRATLMSARRRPMHQIVIVAYLREVRVEAPAANARHKE